MQPASSASSTTADREIVVTRVFDAPRELVFDAFTDPAHISNWWGPDGFTTTTHEMDVRPGGTWRFVMHGPDGVDYDNIIVYREITKPERLVYSHGDAGVPDQFEVTATFADEAGKTRLTWRMVFPSAAERDRVVEEHGALQGAEQTLNRLAQHLASSQ
ncbi:MAG TPA: SRPBCC family protein [Dehalococcoidia bacterium]